MKDMEDIDFSQGSYHNNVGVIAEEKGEYGIFKSNPMSKCQNQNV
jgi:hypothetical protein